MEVTAGAAFQAAGTPKALFKMPSGVLFWDVSPDGSRFLMPVPGTVKAIRSSPERQGWGFQLVYCSC